MARILLADDERDFRAALAEVLRQSGHEVSECASTDEGLELLSGGVFDVVLTDLRMPGRSGIHLLREAAARMPDCVLVVLTAHGSVDSAVEALRIGAHDFFVKPVNLASFRNKIETLLKLRSAVAENRLLRSALEAARAPATGLVGGSKAVQEVHRLIAKVAPTDSTVLILGETGTGKELVARAIHDQSPRRESPFVAVNCGSIPETLLESELFGHMRGAFTGADRSKRGLLEVAGNGTVLLDEIGEMPPSLQPKLLRVLENREVFPVGSTAAVPISARVVASTHRDLPAMIGEGKFRSDLYYRLNVFEIRIPPLRKRAGDIRQIASHLLARVCERMGRPPVALEPEALMALERYAWPGNVRELANVLERSVILAEGPRVSLAELPGLLTARPLETHADLRLARQQFERDHILRMIEQHGGDKKAAAKALGVDLSSLYRKVQEGEESERSHSPGSSAR